MMIMAKLWMTYNHLPVILTVFICSIGTSITEGITTTEPDNTCASQPCENGGTCLRLREAFVCQCAEGYVGLRCETHESDQEQTACASQPCVHGLCHSTNPSSYTCMCYMGWKGSNCNIDDNECIKGDRCSSKQTCVNLIGTYECRCPAGYTGERCDKDICTAANPCLNGGKCQRAPDTDIGYTCSCLQGYGGENCQASECATNFCLNGGSCYEEDDSRFCECSLGYAGSFCETRENYSPCESQPCGNNSMCKEVNDSTGYECMLGCSSQPCQNGGSCATSFDDPNGYMCQCAIGYTGRLCDQKLHAVCYYNGDSFLHGEVRIDECNKCHCKFGSWLCTTKFCGTIAVMLDFTEDFSLLTGRTAKFKSAFELHLSESININRNVIQDMQLSAGGIHVEFNLVAIADVDTNIEEAATNVVLLLDSGHYIFPFEGHAFHVDPTSVQLVKHEPTEANQSYEPVVTHSLLVTVCVVVSVTLVLAVITGLIIIFVKRSKSEKTAVNQFNTHAAINMNKLNNLDNACTKQNNLENQHSYNSVSRESDEEEESDTKNVNLYVDDMLY